MTKRKAYKTLNAPSSMRQLDLKKLLSNPSAENPDVQKLKVTRDKLVDENAYYDAGLSPNSGLNQALKNSHNRQLDHKPVTTRDVGVNTSPSLEYNL